MRARGTQMGNYFWGCVLELCLLGISDPIEGSGRLPAASAEPGGSRPATSSLAPYLSRVFRWAPLERASWTIHCGDERAPIDRFATGCTQFCMI